MTASTLTRTDQHPTTYSFGTGMAAGVWLGLGVAPLCVLGASLLLAILALTVGVALPLAATPCVLAAVVCLLPVRGRSLLGWVSPAAAHTTGAASGAARWTAPIPTAPAPPRPVRLQLPGEFGRPRLHACVDDARIGVVIDVPTRTATVMFAVAGVDRFPLLDVSERDQLLGAWGHALAVIADTEPHLIRLQLLDRATPGDCSDSDSETSDLDCVVRQLSVAHDTLLAAQWQLPRAGAALSTFVTAGRCRSITTPLLAAQLVARPLSVEETAARLAAVFSHAASGAEGRPLTTVSRRTDWSHVRTDDTWHRSYAVSRWPASPVAAGWLAPLLFATPPQGTRTVAIHMHRVDPAEAQRLARAARARAQLDRADRARLGLTSAATVDRAEQASVGMDEELAAGFRTHRMAALVTVSAPDLGCLDDATDVVRQAAASARLELSPLHGQHDVALAATAPLCRLRSRSQR